MTWKSRLRFITGIIVTIGMVFGLFVYLNYSMSRVTSETAQLDADSYSVGFDYSGILDKSYVQVGATVKAGDKLFEVRSTALETSLAENQVQKGSLLFGLTDDGSVLVTASKPGVVRKVNYQIGSFIPANSEIASISLDGALYVQATYRLSSPDYARINYDSVVTVILPDNKKVEGKIYDVSLARNTDQKRVETVVKARLNPNDVNTSVFVPGTPVDTTWQLDSDTLYNTIIQAINNLIRPQSGGSR